MTNVAFYALGCTTIAIVVVVFVGKRRDVSWGTVYFAGPKVAIHPERYLVPYFAIWIRKLAPVWLGLFVLAAVALSLEAT